MAQRIVVPEKVAESLLATFPGKVKRRRCRAPKLCNTCRNVAQRLSNCCSRSRDLGRARPNTAKFDQQLANFGRILPNVGRYWPKPPTIAEIGSNLDSRRILSTIVGQLLGNFWTIGCCGHVLHHPESHANVAPPPPGGGAWSKRSPRRGPCRTPTHTMAQARHLRIRGSAWRPSPRPSLRSHSVGA